MVRSCRSARSNPLVASCRSPLEVPNKTVRPVPGSAARHRGMARSQRTAPALPVRSSALRWVPPIRFVNDATAFRRNISLNPVYGALLGCEGVSALRIRGATSQLSTYTLILARQGRQSPVAGPGRAVNLSLRPLCARRRPNVRGHNPSERSASVHAWRSRDRKDPVLTEEDRQRESYCTRKARYNSYKRCLRVDPFPAGRWR